MTDEKKKVEKVPKENKEKIVNDIFNLIPELNEIHKKRWEKKEEVRKNAGIDPFNPTKMFFDGSNFERRNLLSLHKRALVLIRDNLQKARTEVEKERDQQVEVLENEIKNLGQERTDITTTIEKIEPICITTGIHICKKNPEDCELVLNREDVLKALRGVG